MGLYNSLFYLIWYKTALTVIFRQALSEKMDTIEELKEIISDNKESNHEFITEIASQREEIETLRRLIETNGLQVRISINSLVWLYPLTSE